MTAAAPASSKPSGWAPSVRREQQRHHHHLCRQSRQQRQLVHSSSGTAVRALPKVTLYDVYDQQIPYEQAWQWQKQLVEETCTLHKSSSSSSSSDEGSSSSGSGSSCHGTLGSLLLLQHPPVYTLGAGATEGHLKFDAAAPPLPLYRTERGGEVTYHGPGQLVMYPVLGLRQPPLQQDLHWYLRSLEEVVIRALDAVSGLQGERIPGLTGVWVEGQKVAAIGVRASRWVAYHGLALNVVTDLQPFRQIVPCGIADRPVGSVQGLLAAQQQQPEDGWDDPLAAGFQPGEPAAEGGALAALAAAHQASPQQQVDEQQTEQQLLEEYRHGLLDAFQEVFGVELEGADAGSCGRLAGYPHAPTLL